MTGCIRENSVRLAPARWALAAVQSLGRNIGAAAGISITAGRHLLQGHEALGYVRARKSLTGGSDINRIKRQQAFMSSVAQKAVAYGFPGVRVDGNDLLAMIAATSAAAARGRAGEGPTLIDAVTYRRAGHSSSDDPSVYRKGKEDEIREWERRDPMSRFGKYITRRGLLTDAIDAQYRQELNDEIMAALQHAETVGTPPLSSLFEDVFAQPTANLREQQAELEAMPRQKLGHG